MEKKPIWLCIALALMLLFVGCSSDGDGDTTSDVSDKISRPGQYEGYSPVLYDGWELSSVYIPLNDAERTRLAADIIRPTKDGVVVEEPLPVLWMHTPYNRRPLDGPSAAITYPSGPIDLIQYGYVVAVVDFRGLYASFGHNQLYNFGEYADPAWYDAYDITEWLAEQPWSNGNIGMWGCSATGGSQQQAAYTTPPHLKAIFPLSANFDAYDFRQTGGVPSQRPTANDNGANAARDVNASPVDGPDGPALLEEAKAGHTDDPSNQSEGLDFRDGISPYNDLGEWWRRSSAYPYIGDVADAGIAVYGGANWDESVTKEAMPLFFNNLPREQAKLIIGPCGHCAWSQVFDETGLEIQTEQHRFFDYWLKGIDNGIMEEPAVTYYTYNAPTGEEWRQSETFPLANEQRTTFYLGNGALATNAPAEEVGDITELGDPAPSNPVAIIPDPSVGLIYDSAVLEQDTEVTGYPVVKLWIDSQTQDTDVVAVLLDVAPDGSTRTYQMVGRLRASHRLEGEAPYNNLGLPYHTHLEDDVRLLEPGTPVELEFSLFAMSYIFPEGHRIRLVVSFSDPAGGEGNVTVLTGGERASSVTLPIIPAQ